MDATTTPTAPDIDLEIIDTMATEKRCDLYPATDRPCPEQLDLQGGWAVWRDYSDNIHFHARVSAAQAVQLVESLDSGRCRNADGSLDPASLVFKVRPVMGIRFPMHTANCPVQVGASYCICGYQELATPEPDPNRCPVCGGYLGDYGTCVTIGCPEVTE